MPRKGGKEALVEQRSFTAISPLLFLALVDIELSNINPKYHLTHRKRGLTQMDSKHFVTDPN